MKSFMVGLFIGTGIGIGMLVCPQVRHFVDKIENKIMKKKKKRDEETEE